MREKKEDREYETSSEYCVIGSLLIDINSIQEIYGRLKSGMFTDKILSCAYEIFEHQFEHGQDIDMNWLQSEINEKTGEPDGVIFEVIHACFDSVVTSVNIKLHAEKVMMKYARRRVEHTLLEIKRKPDEFMGVFHDLAKELEELSFSKESEYNSLAEISEKYKDNYFKEKEKTYLRTGIKAIDETIGEFEGGDLIVIGARPAVGKSAFATQIVNNLAHDGHKVGYFNLEMTETQVYERFVANESGIGLTRIRRAIRFMNDEQEKYTAAVERLMKKDKIIIPTGSKTVSKIRAITKREKFDIIIVDYLQLIIPESRYKGNRSAEVGEISHGLKAISIDEHIPVIVLTQLNRVSAGGKEPSMSEIRESGDIEQDASVILLLWNKDENDYTKKGYNIDKNRQGTLRKGELRFDGDRMKFFDTEDFNDINDLDDMEIPFDV